MTTRDTAAKKIAKDFHFSVPENGKAKGKDKDKKQKHYVQNTLNQALLRRL